MKLRLYLFLVIGLCTSSCQRHDEVPVTPGTPVDSLNLAGYWRNVTQMPSFYPTAQYSLEGMVTLSYDTIYFMGLGKAPGMMHSDSLGELAFCKNFMSYFTERQYSIPGGMIVNQWIGLGTLFPAPGRTHAVSFTIGDDIYIGLGEHTVCYRNGTIHTTYYDDFWIYNMKLQEWRKCLYDFPEKSVRGVFSCGIDGKGYVGTDRIASDTLASTQQNKFYEFSPESGWQEIELRNYSVFNKRRGAITVKVGRMVYHGLGCKDNQLQGDLWKFNPDKQDWDGIIIMNNVPGLARAYASAFTLWYKNEPYIYIIGGEREKDSPACMIYNPRTRSWRSGSTPPSEIGKCTGLPFNGRQPQSAIIHNMEEEWEHNVVLTLVPPDRFQ